MAITTPSMGLKRWDQPNDVFSYTELSDNFNLIDLHDHSTGKGVQIPSGGIANLAVSNTKIANLAVDASKLAADAVTTTKILNANVTDAKLASPNNGIYRTIFEAYALFGGGGTGPFAPSSSGSMQLSGNSSGVTVVPVFPFAAANYAVAGKTTKLRVLTVVGTNAVAMTTNITFGLAAVTASGGASSNMSTTFNSTFVTGSSATLNAPATSSRFTVTGSDFDIPADGYYTLVMTQSGTSGAGAELSVTMLLQLRYV